MADHVDELEPGQELEWVGLPIEDQLLDHLSTPEGCTAVWKDALDPVCVEDDGIRDALEFVLEYMDKHREPPPVAILSEETGYDDFRVPVAPIDYVIEKLRDIYKRQELREVIRKVGRLSGDPEQALSHGLSEFSRIQLATASHKGVLTSDDMLSTIERYEDRLQNDKTGISFGYPEIDRILGGLGLGELTFVLGRPKRYKSWQLLKSADAAWESGIDVAFQTMELSGEDMLDRWVCMRAGISWSKFTHGTLSSADFKLIQEAYEEVQSYAHKITFFRPQAGERNVRHLVGLASEVNAGVMYIDQLSWFDDAKSDDKNWLKIGRICEQMKDAASLFPIFCAAQFNREAASLTEIADLAKIGLSDSIGQTGDLLLGLYASSEMHDQKLLHYGVVESRKFEKASWEVKVDLGADSNFRVLNRLTND